MLGKDATQEDIIQQRTLELRGSEARFHNIVTLSTDGIVIVDGFGMILFVNPAATALFGRKVEDLLGEPFGFPIVAGATTELDIANRKGKLTIAEMRVAVTEWEEQPAYLATLRDITARKQLQEEIQDAREYAESIVETVREPLLVLNSDLKILTANQSFFATFKVTPEETIGNFIYDLGNRQWDIPQLRVLIEELIPHDTVFNGYEVEHDFLDIGRKYMLLNARQIFRKNVGSRIILLAMEDITDRKLAEERIGDIIRQQQAILDNIPDIAWLKDRQGRYAAVNEPFAQALGVTPADLIGKTDHEIYPLDLAVKYANDSREVMATGARTCFEEAKIDREGKTQHLEKFETPIFNDTGLVIGIIGIAHDITSRKEVEDTLRHESTHDVLTGLFNRAFFDEESKRLAQSGKFPLTIVMADVNDLKTVNDTLGHEAGDELLQLAAGVIRSAFRAEDIVARIGGDEFAVLLPGKAAAVAEEAVQRIMCCPEIANGQASIAFGIASAENEDQLAEALKVSDERMYRDKSDQKESKEESGGRSP
jgi:diguanylate cyclase (GGDEF)-like protein/PAS domain S-box-containing protein